LTGSEKEAGITKYMWSIDRKVHCRWALPRSTGWSGGQRALALEVAETC